MFRLAPVASTAVSNSDAVNAESPQPSQYLPDPLPSSFRVLHESRLTPHPLVVRVQGHRHTDLPSATHVGRALGSSSPIKPAGVLEPWQKLDGVADMQSVWEKYEDVFFGDYQPVPSTYRR